MAIREGVFTAHFLNDMLYRRRIMWNHIDTSSAEWPIQSKNRTNRYQIFLNSNKSNTKKIGPPSPRIVFTYLHFFLLRRVLPNWHLFKYRDVYFNFMCLKCVCARVCLLLATWLEYISAWLDLTWLWNKSRHILLPQ